LRVWGGGWLEYSHQTFGVSLHLVSTPVYQWYILGGTPGDTVDSSEFALWDSAASDFLVEHNQNFGVDLEWYKKDPPTGHTPAGRPGGGEAAHRVQLLYGRRPARDVGRRRQRG
jgi:hypothetical protein